MTLQIDFAHDVAARCIEKLTEAGYTPNPANDEYAIYTYVSVRHRRVRPRPRAVHRASYTVPAHLADGERQLREKVEAGGDLWPHQSRRIGKPSAMDGMLNDFGIQHFHLGTSPDARHANLIAGTKEVLFAIVEDDNFYAIGIYDHDAWTQRAVVDVVHATWPELTEPYTLRDSPEGKLVGLSEDLTDEQYATLRTKNVNALQQRPDGTIQMGMGGGSMSNGSSFVVRRETDRFVDHIQQLQIEVEVALAKEVRAGRLPEDAGVQVVWEGNKTYAVTDPPAIRVDISGQLGIPPL